MRPHLSINVSNVTQSVEFYKRVFGVEPQKQTAQYAKFDLPILNFTMQSGGERMISRVNHLGIEVKSTDDVKEWEKKLIQTGVLTTPETNTTCCFAKQDKVWFQDPDGNAWEIFVVHEQLPTHTTSSSLETPFEAVEKLGKKCC